MVYWLQWKAAKFEKPDEKYSCAQTKGKWRYDWSKLTGPFFRESSLGWIINEHKGRIPQEVPNDRRSNPPPKAIPQFRLWQIQTTHIRWSRKLHSESLPARWSKQTNAGDQITEGRDWKEKKFSWEKKQFVLKAGWVLQQRIGDDKRDRLERGRWRRSYSY